jgi:hypothetical protein
MYFKELTIHFGHNPDCQIHAFNQIQRKMEADSRILAGNKGDCNEEE